MALPTSDDANLARPKGSPITPEVLQKTVGKIGVNLKVPDHLADDYATALTNARQAMEMVMAMDDFVPVPDTKRFPRTNVYWPSKEENPYNAWAWKGTIKNINAEEARRGPLYGKTICFKDNVCIAGITCYNGTDIIGDWVPRTDATIVTRVLEAGGTIVGKAMCENFSSHAASNTSAFGSVLNPYDTTRSAGGSSSGTGVLVAIGAADLGIGCDQGGSVRVPSAHVGIVGLKPTFGLVPYTGIIPGELSVDHVGPMTPDVMSNALLLKVIAGVDGIDDRQGRGVPLPCEVPDYPSLLQTARESKTLLAMPVGPKEEGLKVTAVLQRPMKIGVLKESGEMPGMDPRVFECVKKAANKFEQLGAIVEEVSVPGHLIASLVARVHRFSQANNMLGRSSGRSQLYLNDWTALINPWTQEKWDKLFPSTASALINGVYADEHYPQIHGKAHNILRKLRLEYDAALQEYDVLVTPTCPWVPKVSLPQDASLVEHLKEVTGLISNAQPFNHTGHPAISIPCGMLPPPDSEDRPQSLKLPVGMQLVGRHFDELTLYKASLAWSDAFNWKDLLIGEGIPSDG